MTNLDSILKSRDITLPTKVHLVKVLGFPVVLYGCESWTIKKAEHRRTDALELWCWRRLLRVLWTARSNQSIQKEISPEYSLEGLMLKLKLQYFGHLMQKTDSFEKDPDAGKDWRQEEMGRTEYEMVGWHYRLDGHWVWTSSRSWWNTGKPGMLQSVRSQRVRHDWVTEAELNWKWVCLVTQVISQHSPWPSPFSHWLSLTHPQSYEGEWPQSIKHSRE